MTRPASPSTLPNWPQRKKDGYDFYDQFPGEIASETAVLSLGINIAAATE